VIHKGPRGGRRGGTAAAETGSPAASPPCWQRAPGELEQDAADPGAATASPREAATSLATRDASTF